MHLILLYSVILAQKYGIYLDSNRYGKKRKGFFFFLFFFAKTVSYTVAQANLKLAICLPLLPRHRPTSTCPHAPASMVLHITMDILLTKETVLKV